MGWLDVLNLAVDVSQSYQLHKIKGSIGAMQEGNIEDRLFKEIIETLKNIVFSVSEDLKTIKPKALEAPGQVLAVANILEWRLNNYGITAKIFPELSDKEFTQNTIRGIQEVKNQTTQLLDYEMLNRANAASSNMMEIPQLKEWMSHLDNKQRLAELESSIQSMKSTRSTGNLLMGLGMAATLVLCVLTMDGSASYVFWAIPILLVIFGAVQRSKNKDLLKTQTEEHKILSQSMLDNERVKELKEHYSGLSLEGAEKMLNEKISAVQNFMGGVMGFDQLMLDE